jgi:predicted metalloprotease with PDZ domain
VTVYGIETSPVWPNLVQRAAEPLGLRLQLVKDGLGPSDHTSFSARGVPALLFFTGVHDEYHTPDDDRVNAAGIVRVAQLVHRVAWSLANSPARPPARPAGATLHPSGERGYGVYLGIIPAFGGEPVPGVRIQGVRADSPAEKAGLRKGDVIVSFDGAEIANLEEFAALLFRAEPGRDVEIVVQRDGARVPLHATLGERR